MSTEAWLRGPVPDTIAELVPAAHIMIQAGEELSETVSELSPRELWANPGGAASIGFYLTHIAGSIDRLLTYARGAGLDENQRAALAAEKQPNGTATVSDLLALALQAIDQTLTVYRDTERAALFEKRTVGRAQLPSDVIGLLYHVAAHTMRHTGQVIATRKAMGS